MSKPRTHRRPGLPWALSLLFLALGAGLILPLRGHGEAPEPAAAPVRPVKLFELAAPGGGPAWSLPGTVQSAHRARLAFRVPGLVESLPVREGQRVAEGQTVARLDPTDYAQAVRALEAALSGARAALTEAGLTLGRSETLFAQGMVPKATLDEARSAHDQAEAAVKRLTAELAQARNNLGYTDLRAPFSGTVARTLVDNHENVQAQQGILDLRDTARLEVVVNVPEGDAAAIRPGQAATARFESLPGREAALAVTEIAAEADADTRTYAVTLALDASSGDAVLPLLPGMTAEVVLRGVKRAADLFRVPVSAVFADDAGKTFVWRLRDGAVHKVAVALGDLGGETIGVSGPLAPGERIVSAGVHFLAEGQRVRPLDEIKDVAP